MDRRSFLMSAAVTAALFFTGCKSEESKPADAQPAAAQKCACPEGQCACPECKAGDMASCSCAAAPADAGGTSGQ